MNPFKRLAAWLGRGKQKAPGGAPALTGPRFYHTMDLHSMTCRRCGVSYVVSARVPCKSLPRVVRRDTTFDAIEHNEAPPTIHTPLDATAWAEAFGPLSSTFNVPDTQETPACVTGPVSAPSSSSIPGSGSPSSASNSGGKGSASTSSSCDCDCSGDCGNHGPD